MSQELTLVSNTASIIFDKRDTTPRKSVNTDKVVDIFTQAKAFFGQFIDSFGQIIFNPLGSTRLRIIPLSSFYPDILTYVALPISIDAKNNFFFTVYPSQNYNSTFTLGLVYFNARKPQSLPVFSIQNEYMSNSVATPFAFKNIGRQPINVQFLNVRICLSYINQQGQNVVTTPQLLMALAKNSSSQEFSCYINWYIQDPESRKWFLTNTNDKKAPTPLNLGKIDITGKFIGSFQFYIKYQEPANNYQNQSFQIQPASQSVNAPNSILRNKLLGYDLLSGSFLPDL